MSNNNLIDTLTEMQVERPLSKDELDGWINNFQTGTVLTERQAEFFVRAFGTHQTQKEMANAMSVSEARISNLKTETRNALNEIDRTEHLIQELRDAVGFLDE